MARSMLLRALLLATGLCCIAKAQSYTYNLDRRLNCTTLGCDDKDTVQVLGKVSVDSLGNLSESSFTKWSLTWSSPFYTDTTLTPANSEVKIMGNAIVSATPCQLEIRLPSPSTTTQTVDNDSLFGIRDIQPDPYMVEFVMFGVQTDAGLFESTEVIGHSPRNSLEGNTRDEGRMTVVGDFTVLLLADEGTLCDNGKDNATQDFCRQGSCVTGTSTGNCDDGNNCTESLVILETGECVHDPVAAGTKCLMDGGDIGSCNTSGECMSLVSSTTRIAFGTADKGTDMPPTEENEKDSVVTTTTEAYSTTRERPKKNPVCNPSVCQACFYYCGLPPYTCDASSKSRSCRVDPWCLFCEKVCSNEDCPGGCLSDPRDFVCDVNPTRRRRLFSTN